MPFRAGLTACGLLLATACAGAGAAGGGSGQVVTVAVVSNPQMTDIKTLTPEFERAHPGVRVKYVSLPENEARDKITQSVATHSGVFDVVMISNYETPIWARNGWLTDLQSRAASTPGYDPGDILPNISKSLQYRGHLYSVPFYGEGSFLMYRKDIFAAHHLTMPAHPTWGQVAALAHKLNDPAHDRAGICLRGKPGWGEVLAPLDTVVNTFGGRWFDPSWNATLNSPEVNQAVSFYTNLVRTAGEPGAATSGFTECLTDYSEGNAAMMYDSTVAASTLEDPTSSKVVGKTGYVAAPVQRTKHSGWLYTWSLGIPKTTTNKAAAWAYTQWATSKQYIKLVGDKLGWARLPPGSRTSTYQLPQYKKAAGAFAGPTLDAISHADQSHPSVKPVPYTGIQFVDIPEFVDLGTRTSQQFSAAIAGQKTVTEALAQSQAYAATVAETYRTAGKG
jgi:sorbitol/mannitol transport system substrate-binding protein